VPFVPSVAIGASALALAAAGIAATRASRLLGCAALMCLWLAFGTHLGAEQALQWVPIWGSFRYAEKMIGPFTLCCALLGGLGATRFACQPSRRWTVTVVALAIIVCAIALPLGAGAGVNLIGNVIRDQQVAMLARHQLAIGTAHAAAGTVALAMLLIAAHAMPAVARRFAMLAACLVFVQGLASAPFAIHVGAKDAREARPLTQLSGTAEVVRIATPLRGVIPGHVTGLDRSDAMLAVESRMGVTPYAAASGIDHIDTYSALLPWQRVLVDNTLGWPRHPEYWSAMRRYAITHVVLRPPHGSTETARADAAAGGGRLLFEEPSWGYSVWEVPHRPWATFVERVAEALTPRDALHLLQAAARNEGPDAVLEGWSPDGGFPPTLRTGRVLRIQRATETLRIEATANHPGVLLINDSWAPGWVASLDGRPVPIMRADALVRAVPWPAGSRVLEMRYDPPEVRAGIWMTLIASATAIAVAMYSAMYRRMIRRRPT
jgi:hypothetical protein